MNWFTDQDGKLEGVFLINAQRFRRDQIARDRAANILKDSEEYWASVPGSNLYLAASSLANYNIRYVEPSDIDFVEQELGEGIVITPLPPDGELHGSQTQQNRASTEDDH